jgi:hypothetical protein
MGNKETYLVDIITAAVSAPSGDNTQHWRFTVHDHVIGVFLVHQKSVYGPSAFHIGIGALIENIVIAADHYGYFAEVATFPDQNNVLHIANISLTPDGIDHGVDLFRFFAKRYTNRYPYQPIQLPSFAIRTLTDPANLPPGARIVPLTQRAEVKTLGHTVSKQATILFSHRSLHDEFYKSIRWDGGRAEPPDGIPVSTLGLTPVEVFFFKYLLRFWAFLSVLRFLGIPFLAAWLESFRHTRASAYFALVVPRSSLSPSTEVAAGRSLEQFWLKATKLGLSAQPSGALLLLHDGITKGNFTGASWQHKLIIDSTTSLHKLIGATHDEAVLWIMRTGLASKIPQTRTVRRTPNIVFEKQQQLP